jgi:hypothetical protein
MPEQDRKYLLIVKIWLGYGGVIPVAHLKGFNSLRDDGKALLVEVEITRFRNNCEALGKLWLGRLARRREISLHDKRENVMALISGLLI